MRDLGTCWIGLAEPDDLILSDNHDTPPFITQQQIAELSEPSRVNLIPWGWTNAIHEWGKQYGLKVNHPDIGIIRRVNSRRYSFQLEQEFDTLLPHACEITDSSQRPDSQMRDALTRLQKDYDKWVIKASWGMSGRERILGSESSANGTQQMWIDKRLKSDATTFLEPWVNAQEELSFQWQIDQSGSIQFVGATKLLNDSNGSYVGSRILSEIPDEWTVSFEAVEHAVCDIANNGYWGPVGVDAMKYLDNKGNEQFRPIQDINARFTMGRMALAMQRLLKSGEVGSWLHIRGNRRCQRSAVDLVTDLPNHIDNVRCITPPHFESDAWRIPILMATTSEEDLELAESEVLGLMFDTAD